MAGTGYTPTLEVATLLREVEEELASILASTQLRPEPPAPLPALLPLDEAGPRDYLEELKGDRADTEVRIPTSTARDGATLSQAPASRRRHSRACGMGWRAFTLCLQTHRPMRRRQTSSPRS